MRFDVKYAYFIFVERLLRVNNDEEEEAEDWWQGDSIYIIYVRRLLEKFRRRISIEMHIMVWALNIMFYNSFHATMDIEITY